MKKFYISLMALLLGAFSAQAQVMTSENSVLGEEYALTRYFNFTSQTEEVKGTEIVWDSGDINSTAADFKVGSTTVYAVNTMPGWYVQSSDLRMRTDRSPKHLKNYGSGTRAACYTGVKAGQIVVVEGYPYDATKWAYSSASLTENVVEITDSIHAIQELIDADGDGVADATNDGLYYYKVVEDGNFAVGVCRAGFLYGVQIWTSTSSPEYVTNPSSALTKVDGTAREVTITPGESSYGNEVRTFYSLDGSYPLFREEVGQTENTITVQKVDEETGDTITYDSVYYTPIYQLTPSDGVWGDWEYVDMDYVEFSEADDEDGDGYVTLTVVSVTEEGVVSEAVSNAYQIGDINLNAPVLTLVDVSGTSRSYQIAWTNNTLCGEEYTVTVETGEGDSFEAAVGDVVNSASNLTVTVHADGYVDGVTYLEVAMPDTVYETKYLEDGTELTWDFVNLSEDMINKISGKVIDYVYYLDENNDTVKISAEDYEAGTVAVPENAVEVYKNYGWDFDSSKARAFRSVVRDTIWTDEETYTVNATYVEDGTGLLSQNGMTVDCAINANNNSTIGIYTNPSSNLGLYLMNTSTVTITGLKYGEVVVAGFGRGGSNYINTYWTSVYTADETGTVTIPISASTFLQYVKVYTSETLPNIPEAIENVLNNKVNTNIYSIDGRLVRKNATDTNGLKKGVYIFNGHKVLVK